MRTWANKERHRWIKDSNGWWYRGADGAYPTNKRCVINRHWYLFNKDGYIYASRHHWDGRVCNPEDGSRDWYHFGPTQDSTQKGACQRSRENGAQETWCIDETDDT